MDEHIAFRNPVKAVGYSQMYHMATLDPRITDGAYRLLALYLMYAQQKGACWPGRDRLAEELYIQPVTISRRNDELVKAGYILRESRGKGHSWMTYIEDYEQIPFLKQKASELLSARGVKNDMPKDSVSKMIPQTPDSVSNLIPKEEQEFEEKQISRADARDNGSPQNPYVEMGQTQEAMCPHCNHVMDVHALRDRFKSRPEGECLGCGEPLGVTYNGEVLIRPKPDEQPRRNVGWLPAVRAFCDLAHVKYGTLGPKRMREWAIVLRDGATEQGCSLEDALRIIPQLDVWQVEGLTNPRQKRFWNAWDPFVVERTPESKLIVIDQDWDKIKGDVIWN